MSRCTAEFQPPECPFTWQCQYDAGHRMDHTALSWDVPGVSWVRFTWAAAVDEAHDD